MKSDARVDYNWQPGHAGGIIYMGPRRLSLTWAYIPGMDPGGPRGHGPS